MHRSVFSGLVAASLLALGTSASGVTITLSEMSSDGTPAGFFDATVVLTDLGGGLLQIDLTNDTVVPNEYDINELHLNLAGATVTGFNVAVTGWTLNTIVSGVDGFGDFEVHLTDGVGPSTSQVVPGETQTFVLTYSGVLGAGILEANSPQGKMVAAKFVEGPGANALDECPPFTGECPDEDSGWGASGSDSVVVPEPATAWLLGLGIAGLFVSGRKRA